MQIKTFRKLNLLGNREEIPQFKILTQKSKILQFPKKRAKAINYTTLSYPWATNTPYVSYKPTTIILNYL